MIKQIFSGLSLSSSLNFFSFFVGSCEIGKSDDVYIKVRIDLVVNTKKIKIIKEYSYLKWSEETDWK